jgi:hypothetical protein
MSQLVLIGSPSLPVLVAVAGERASMRFWNSSRPTSATATRAGRMDAPPRNFLAWCASIGVPSIAAVQPVHVAT